MQGDAGVGTNGHQGQARALIFGVGGQDGAYLAQWLLGKGYAVFGTSRDAERASFSGLTALGIRDRVRTLSAVTTDFRSVFHVISQTAPQEIYNLAGQSSVALSFEQPVETLESISAGTLNILEVLRLAGRHIRFYNAGSSECFGNTGQRPADEETPFHPRSPYAVAKAAAHWQVANYREAYGLFACSGLLFNHESPLRPARFVTRKITSAAARIAAGETLKLELGNIEIRRDWGWAPDYVEAMWAMLQQPQAEDFVIATGRSASLAEFAKAAFGVFGLDWRHHVEVKSTLFRPTDIVTSEGNPAKAEARLGWRARLCMPEVARQMALAENVQTAAPRL